MKAVFIGHVPDDEGLSHHKEPGSIGVTSPANEYYPSCVLVRCPHCNSVHDVPYSADHYKGGRSGPVWGWDEASVTLTPSVNCQLGPMQGHEPPIQRCHFNLTNGEIIMHNDSVLARKVQDGSA